MKLNARLVAFQALVVLLKAESEVVASPIGVLNKLKGIEKLAKVERDLATEIIMGVLRHRLELEQVLKNYYSKKPPFEVLVLLLSASYQLIYLDRVPAYAVINETVSIAQKNLRTQNYTGLINAVLRNLVVKEKTMEQTSNQFALPAWLKQRWINQFGIEKVNEILISLAQPQIAGLWFNFQSSAGIALFEQLANAQQIEAWAVGNDELFTINPDNPPELNYDTLNKEVLSIGLSSQIVGVLTADGTLAGGVFGGRVLDLCAGFGHKSVILRTVLGTDYSYAINDINSDKLQKTAALFQNWGYELPKIYNVDITVEQPLARWAELGTFDLVLIDAPCSGTGTFRRLPNKASSVQEQSILAAAELQSQLLFNAARLIKPGGILAYSVCSLEFEEGVNQIERFIQNSNRRWELRDIYLWDEVEFAVHTTKFGYYLLPVDNALEGFFLAILKSE